MAAPHVPSCIDCNCQSACFRELEPEELSLMNDNRLEVHYKKGESIAKQGTYSPHIMYIKRGLVKVILEHHNKNTILCIERAGTFLGLESLFGEKIFHYSVATYIDSEICLFEIDSFKRMCEENPKFSAKVIESLNERSVRVYDRLITLTQKQLHGKFADILLCLRDRIYFSNSYELDLSRKDLSEITTMSIESLSRVIKEFKEEGIIDIDGKKLTIKDIDRLKQISRTS